MIQTVASFVVLGTISGSSSLHALLMLRVLSPDFPPIAPANPVGGVFGLAVGDPITAGSPIATVNFFENPLVEIQEAIAIPVYSETISVILPNTSEGYTINDIGAVSIGSNRYSPAAIGGSLLPGEYTYDSQTQTLVISPITGTAPQPGEVITYIAIQDKPIVFSDRYTGPIPRFFRQWNVSGPISFQRDFGRSPSGSLTFVMDGDEFRARLCDLAEGTLFEWNGHGYAVAAVDADLLPIQNTVEVTVSLQGPHDHLLDEQVLLREDKSTTSATVGELCDRGSIPYIGQSVTLRISKDRSLRDSTTIGALLDYTRVGAAFPVLSNPKALEFREWDKTTLHRIGPGEIVNDDLDPIQISYNVSGNRYGDVKLSAEYKNTQLNLDNSEGESESENGRTNTLITLRYGSAVSKGGSIVDFTPYRGTDLSTPSNAFDLGGPTKELIIERYQNGTLISRERTTFGYAYKSSDFHSWAVATTSGGNPSAWSLQYNGPLLNDGWGQVARETEQFSFDGDGYLVKIRKRIRKKQRLRQETADRETLELSGIVQFGAAFGAQENAAQLLAQYDYFDVEEEDITDYNLESLEVYYPDLPPRDSSDPIPKFHTRIERRHTAKYDGIDYRKLTDAQNYGQFSAGSDRLEIDDIDIIYPPQGISGRDYIQEKDQFSRTSTVKMASGENLKNATKSGPDTVVQLGRPSAAQRLEVFEDGNNPESLNLDENTRILLLNTPNTGLSSSDPIDGSVSFPGAYTNEQAIAAATLDIAIRNTQEVEVWSNIKMLRQRRLSEGDRVRYKGVVYRVLSVSEPLLIEREGSIGWPFNIVSWGREITPPVEVSEVSE